MGDLYPFSLAAKLKVITEPSPWYSLGDNPWGRPIVPFEMLSVLFQYRAREDRLPVRGPAVGLFADQEIRLLRGPIFVGESYTTEREVVASAAAAAPRACGCARPFSARTMRRWRRCC